MINCKICSRCKKSHSANTKTCEVCLQKNKDWSARNKNKIKKWRIANAERIKIIKKDWALKNPEKTKRYQEKHKTYQKEWAKQRTVKLNKIKIHYGCLNPKCPCKPPLKACCLDFHHTRGKKSFSIGKSSGLAILRLAEEIRKCTILCAVCHRLATWENLNVSEFITCDVDDNCDPPN